MTNEPRAADAPARARRDPSGASADVADPAEGAADGQRTGGRPPSSLDGWWFAAVLGFLGALPTIATIIAGPGFMVDDFGFAATARADGLGGFLHGADIRSRPLQAAYHGFTFVVLGDHPVAHLVLLALLNAAVAILFFRVVRAHLPAIPAALAALWFVVLPNHGSTRVWIATGPIVLAQLLLLAAALVAGRTPRRLWLVVALVAASGLAYEGGLAIGVAVVAFAAWNVPTRRDRIVRLVSSGAALLVVAAWIFLTSPKKADGGNDWFGSVDAVLPSLFGSALLPSSLIAASPLIVLAILGAGIAAILPSSRRAASTHLLAAGAAVTALGIAPFVVTGFPLSTDGMLDRASSFAVFGVALLLAGACEQLWRLPAPVAITVTGILMLVVGSAATRDVAGAIDAQQDARDVLAALEVTPLPEGTRIVVGPTPNREGYAAFGYDALGAAWFLRTGEQLDLHDSVSNAEFEQASGLRLRYLDGRLVVVEP